MHHPQQAHASLERRGSSKEGSQSTVVVQGAAVMAVAAFDCHSGGKSCGCCLIRFHDGDCEWDVKWVAV